MTCKVRRPAPAYTFAGAFPAYDILAAYIAIYLCAYFPKYCHYPPVLGNEKFCFDDLIKTPMRDINEFLLEDVPPVYDVTQPSVLIPIEIYPHVTA